MLAVEEAAAAVGNGGDIVGLEIGVGDLRNFASIVGTGEDAVNEK